MRICLGQIEVIPSQPQKNTAKMLEAIEKAKSDEAELIVFSELAIPGYMLGDIWERTSFLKECEECGEQIREASEGIVVVYGNVAMDWDEKNEDGRVRKYNACFVAENKKFLSPPLGKYPFIIKTLQPDYREFDDNRHFYDYRKYVQFYERHGIYHSPQTNPIFLENGIGIHCSLCEDGWDTDYAYEPMRWAKQVSDDSDISVFINISCSPFTEGKNTKRNRLFAEKAKGLKTPIVYVNCVGMQDIGKTVYTFDGESCVYDINGNVFTPYKPFEEASESFYLWRDFPKEWDKWNNVINFESKDDIAKLYESIKYGTTKFMERHNINKVVIGASGGIDSALVSAIMSEILPKENILLVNMPSRFNSDSTKNAAKDLAENIGCRYIVHSIQDSYNMTFDEIRRLNSDMETAPLLIPYEERDLTSFMLENVQARDRSSRILAAWAAWFGGVFTCNANKSEMTVGYSTLYGDLGGFLAPLADLWKTQVYEMAEWFNKNIKPVIPQGSISIQPSAELSLDQNVDFGKGDPIRYLYHDLLFASWVERWNRATPEDILEWQLDGKLEENLGWNSHTKILYYMFGDDKEAFVDDLERWWNCYQGLAVAKRIQAPPVLAVSRRAFGFDHREAQVGVTYTKTYFQLKSEFLK